MSQATRNPSKQQLCLHGNLIHKYTQTNGEGRAVLRTVVGERWGCGWEIQCCV